MVDFDNRLDREDGIRTMDALDKLKEIDLEEITPLEAAIVYLSHKHEGDATMAAAELAALKVKLENAQKTAIYFSKLGHGVRPSLGATRLIKSYEAALKGDA